MNTVMVGDTVLWRGGFGRDAPQEAIVEAMELTPAPHMKDGEDVEEVSWDLVRKDRVLFILKNGHWAYGNQIQPRR